MIIFVTKKRKTKKNLRKITTHLFQNKDRKTAKNLKNAQKEHTN